MSQTTLIAAALPAVPRPSFRMVLRLWWRRVMTRMDLSEVPDHILRDIGVSRAEAHREARLPFWQG